MGGPVQLNMELPEAEEPGYVDTSNNVIKGSIGDFDVNAKLTAVVAARLDTGTSPETLTELTDITSFASGTTLQWDVPSGDYRIFAIYQNGSSHNLVASAFPTALQRSPALDHLNTAGVQEFITDLGEPWLDALAPYSPNAFFIDSFELIGELPWSDTFKQAFMDMHGYDPTPYLPLMFKKNGESKYVNIVVPPTPAYQSEGDSVDRVREDYELVREQLFKDSFLVPLKAWTQDNGIQLRLQAHGGFGDYLDCYQIADIPEAEGLFGGGTYEFLKLASSAAHVAGRRFVTCESFINMTYEIDVLSLDDYYMLAGNAFAAGVNRTVGHGHAYAFEQ